VEFNKLKEELLQNKMRHHGEIICMVNQLDKAKRKEENLTNNLKQKFERLIQAEVEIGQYKEEAFSLKTQLKEEKK